MSSFTERIVEARKAPRLTLPAAYTLIRVRPIGTRRYRWVGHIYDISLDGMRFELDTPLPAGSQIQVRAMLPGDCHTTVQATGRVVRLHDQTEGDAGPCRMALTITGFATAIDQRRLLDYLESRGIRQRAQTAPPRRQAA